jgi:hypothetical protein
MKRRAFSLLSTACMFCLLGSLAPVSQVATAQSSDAYNFHLSGAYAVQFTGTVFLPAPFNTYNGPFSRNGRVVFDGNGNFTSYVIANYNGNISQDVFSGTYIVNYDGTFTLTIVNLPTPLFPPGTPNVFSFNGMLANNGNIAKLTLSGVSVGGQQQANIGSVIVGELVRQIFQ